MCTTILMLSAIINTIRISCRVLADRKTQSEFHGQFCCVCRM